MEQKEIKPCVVEARQVQGEESKSDKCDENKSSREDEEDEGEKFC